MRLFATAARPENIPERAPDGEQWYGAAPYATGYPWPQAQLLRFPHRFNIIQTPRDLAYYARHARCIDVEYLAVTPQEVERFCNERNALFNDATVYASLDTFGVIHDYDPDMDFRVFLAHWNTDPREQEIVFGKACWAKQYEAFNGYEACVLYARDMDSPL